MRTCAILLPVVSATWLLGAYTIVHRRLWLELVFSALNGVQVYPVSQKPSLLTKTPELLLITLSCLLGHSRFSLHVCLERRSMLLFYDQNLF